MPCANQGCSVDLATLRSSSRIRSSFYPNAPACCDRKDRALSSAKSARAAFPVSLKDAVAPIVQRVCLSTAYRLNTFEACIGKQHNGLKVVEKRGPPAFRLFSTSAP